MAYLKTDGGVQGTISQQVAFPAGDYQVVFALSAARILRAELRRAVRRTVIGSFTVGSTSSYTTQRSNAFTSTGGRHTITSGPPRPRAIARRSSTRCASRPPSPRSPRRCRTPASRRRRRRASNRPVHRGVVVRGPLGHPAQRQRLRRTDRAGGHPDRPPAVAQRRARVVHADPEDGCRHLHAELPGVASPGYSAVQTIQVVVDGTVVDSFAPPTNTFTAHTRRRRSRWRRATGRSRSAARRPRETRRRSSTRSC